MDEQEPDISSDPDKPSPPSTGGHESRRLRITPEQRRFLGPARSRHDWVGAEEKAGETEGHAPLARAVPQRTPEEEYAPPMEENRPPSHSVPYTGGASQSSESEMGGPISEDEHSPERQ